MEELTLQEKWDILLKYLDYSAKLGLLKGIIDGKKKAAENAAVTATLMTMKKLMESQDEAYHKLVNEMNQEGADYIMDMQFPFGERGVDD